MISLKFLSLLFFLVSTSQLTSARPNIAAGESQNIYRRDDTTHELISRRGLPLDLPLLGGNNGIGQITNGLPLNMASLGDSGASNLPLDIPFLGGMGDEESKSSSGAPLDLPILGNNNENGNNGGVGQLTSGLPLNMASFGNNGASSLPFDMPLLGGMGSSERKSSSGLPLDIPLLGNNNGNSGLGTGILKRRSLPFDLPLLGGNNGGVGQLTNGLPLNMASLGNNGASSLPFDMPFLGGMGGGERKSSSGLPLGIPILGGNSGGIASGILKRRSLPLDLTLLGDHDDESQSSGDLPDNLLSLGNHGGASKTGASGLPLNLPLLEGTDNSLDKTTGSDLPTDSILSGVSGSSRKQGGGLPISIPSLGNLL
uniref:Uncharacterized protein n=1 Tax=Phakopsora pachyrhizi TaxID=170000 RepID=A0A0S1MKI6_PHAPC